jgi:hypothetical protein
MHTAGWITAILISEVVSAVDDDRNTDHSIFLCLSFTIYQRLYSP